MAARSHAFWVAYDVGTALIAIVASSDMLIRFGLGTPGWLLAYVLVAARIAVVWRAAFDLAVRNWIYFLYPAVCIASVLWSTNSNQTLTASIQLTMTIIIALFIGWRFSLAAICLLQLMGQSLGLGLSLVNWATGMFGELYAPRGGLLGIYSQKNMLGQRALAAILSALAILLLPRSSASGLIKLGCLGVLAVAGFLLIKSDAVTAILLVPAMGGILLLLLVHRLPQSLVLAGLVLGVLLTALVPVGLAVMSVDPLQLVLGTFDRSSNLTGRTSLWALAQGIIVDYPILGVGFQAFWSSSAFANLANYATNYGETVTAFHNFILEVWVGTGIPGVIAIIALVGTSLSRAIQLWLLTRSTMSAYAIVSILTSIILSFVGTGLYRQHEYTIMLTVMLGVAAGRELRIAKAALWQEQLRAVPEPARA